jgi:N-acyl-D-amino-acid deacylase
MSAESAGQYYRAVRAHRLPTNCYTLIGNVTLREMVGLGRYDTASPEQVKKMEALCRRALEEGALGVSFGLQYAPGTALPEEEALFSLAAQYDRYVAVHMRYDFPTKALDAVEEVVTLAEKTGAKLQISHLPANVYGDDNIKKAAARILSSKADVSCDVYPYNVWATSIQSAVFDAGFDNFNFNVTDLELVNGEYAGQYCTPELFERLRTAEHDTVVACHNAMPIEDVEAAYRLPFAMVGSDAMMQQSPDGTINGHPRGAGSPAKFLREFVREKQLISLPDAIAKLTLLPANRCGLKTKGRLQPGCDADIVLFDYDAVRENAAFGPDVCAAAPDGFVLVMTDGEITGCRGQNDDASRCGA